MTFHGKLSPRQVLPRTAARRTRAEKGSCACNHQAKGHTFPPQGTCMTGGHSSHLPSPGRAQRSGVTPSLPRACTGVTGHTFPPQLVHRGHRSHVSPGRMHVECLPAGQEGSRACPVPPPPGARPQSRCNGQAVEQPEIHRAALWPALLSVDLCPPSHSSRES